MDDIVTVEQAAQLVGVNVQTMRRLVRDGEVGGRKVGAVWVLDRVAVEDFAKTYIARRGPKGPREGTDQ